MVIVLLFLVLMANGASIALRRQFREESWKYIHTAIAGWVLTASGFLVVLSLYLVFASVEIGQPSQNEELNVFYSALILFVVSLAVSLSHFFRRKDI